MSLVAAARRASSFVLLRASSALLRPVVWTATAIRGSSSSPDSAKIALLRATLDSINAKVDTCASAAALDSVRAAVDSLRTSTFDDLLVRDIDTVIKDSSEPTTLNKMKETQGFFPFEITDHPLMDNTWHHGDITLERTFEDEQIQIRAYTTTSYNNITLSVTVTKRNSSQLEFGCTAYPAFFSIDSMWLKEEPTYEIFRELDMKTQRSFYKYLEQRGITRRTMNSLRRYMKPSCEPRVHHFLLNKLSGFIKKD